MAASRAVTDVPSRICRPWRGFAATLWTRPRNAAADRRRSPQAAAELPPISGAKHGAERRRKTGRRSAAESRREALPKCRRSAAEFWGEAPPRTGTPNAAADVPPKCRPMIERSTPKRRRQTAARPSAKHGAERRRQSAAKPSAKPCRPSAAAQRGARRKPPTNRRRFRARSTAANWFLTHATMQSAPPPLFRFARFARSAPNSPPPHDDLECASTQKSFLN